MSPGTIVTHPTTAAAPDAVTVARRAWLAAACALGAHKPNCLYCTHQQECAEFVLLDVEERDLWDALERARMGQP